MKLIFVDEFDCHSEENIFGVALIVIDATKYRAICEEFSRILKKNSWDPNTEIKGNYLFSRDPAGQTKTPEEMISLIKDLINLISGLRNARCSLISSFIREQRSTEQYRELLCHSLNKIKKNSSGGIKSLVSVYCDKWDQILNPLEKKKLDDQAKDCLNERGYYLIESAIHMEKSYNGTPGIIFADVLSHLCKWIVENPKKKDLNLLDFIPGKPTTARKANIVHEIISQIRDGVIYEVVKH